MSVAKRKAKAHALLTKKANEPMLDQENYNVSIGSALVWYTNNTDDKTRRKYAIEYFAKLGKKKEVLAINKANDYDVRQLGTLCRLITNGNVLTESHMQTIDTMVSDIVAKANLPKKAKEEVVVVDTTPVVSIQQRMEDKAHELAGEIEGAIDEFTTNKKSDFSTKNYLLANEVSAPIAKRIGEFYVATAQEIREALAGDDEQLVEGYSHFTKRELKKFAEFIETIISDCQQMVQTAKASRAPRKRKPVPASKQVSKMKYLKTFEPLNLKSCKPEDIITSSEVWVYNTKYRKVQVYRAEMGTLSVKGTTIIGFSVTQSQSMTLRKPEEFFKGLTLGKRPLNAAFKKLTTKPTTPNGRVNEECVLLGAF